MPQDKFSISNRPRGFTLIEMLIVIGIISILLGILTVWFLKAKEKVRFDNTRVLISTIVAALDEYKSTHGEYPSSEVGGFPERVPDLSLGDPEFMKGVELEVTWLTKRSPGAVFSKKYLDSNDRNYFKDPYGYRIRYRKYSVDRMLVWSVGKDGVNDIGSTKKESMGDDVDMRK